MRPHKMYQQVGITTADPLRLIVMLYEGAIRNLNQWQRLIDQDPGEASARLTRTLEIINYLRAALDREKGGEIALNLERLYEYMRDRLADANISNDRDKVAEVIRLLQTLLDGWHGIASSQGHVTPVPTEPLNLSMVG